MFQPGDASRLARVGVGEARLELAGFGRIWKEVVSAKRGGVGRKGQEVGRNVQKAPKNKVARGPVWNEDCPLGRARRFPNREPDLSCFQEGRG